MNSKLKLLIPLALGVLAAAMNFMSHMNATRPVSFVMVTEPLKPGDELSTSNTAVCEIPEKHVGSMQGTFMPYRDIGILASPIRVGREFKKGDLVLTSDIADPFYEANTEIMYISANLGLPSNALRVKQKVTFVCAMKDKPSSEMNPENANPSTFKIGPFELVSVGTKTRENDDKEVTTNVLGIRIAGNDINREHLSKLELVQAGQGEIISLIKHESKK